MAALRPTSGNANAKSTPLPSSPNTASLSPSPISGLTSPGSPSTNATSAAPPSLPSDEEVEAVIKQATSNRAMPDGRPPPSKDTRTQLFAGNLPYRVRWQDLKDLFRRAGTVLRADVSLTPDNRSRGYGTVLLASAEDAGRAVDMFNGYNWQGRVLEVRLDRLGNVPGGDIDANVGTLVQGVGIAAVGALNALAPNIGQLNGLHVPSPHPSLPFVTQQPSGNGQALGNNSPAILPTTSFLTNGAQTAAASAPLNSLKPNLIAFQQQELQAQREREKDDLLMNQGAPGRPQIGGLDPFLGSLNRGLSADLDREQARSSLGMRSLFVGNLPFHCQWQDLKDLFRQAGTILRADVSLGPDGRSRGFGTVTFANEIDAERAVAMFNGFDYNGRILKVHYDKFCASSPILSTLSPNPSNLATPVQSSANSAQAVLAQAAQLHQLVGGQTYDHIDAFSNWNGSRNGNNGNDVNTNGFTSHSRSQGFGNNLQATLEPFPLQSQSRPTTSSGSSNEQVRQRVTSTTSEASVSPFHVHLPGPSPSLAERRQKIPPPIGPVSSSSSRRPSAAGTTSAPNADLLNVNAATSSGAMTGTSLGASPASPTRERRSTGQSLPAPSTCAPSRTTAEFSNSEGNRATSGSSSTSNATPAGPSRSEQSSHSTSTNPTSPRSSHPAHPGPISLPPPLPASSFPVYSPHHHPMSPPGQHPMSPPMYAGYPSYGPMSPMHAYSVPHYMHPANMTPHGLPPITPSMPSFSFAPPPQPSPSVPVGGSSAIPPTPADGTVPAPEGYPPSGQPGDSSGRGMGMVPMMSPPLPLPHHVFQPFTPGTVVSPGAFYGRPIGVPPPEAYLNHTAGSPIVGYPTYAYPHPGSQPGSPYYHYNVTGGHYGEESSGYFPPVGPPHSQHPQQPPRHEGYFPPVSALGSSGLASEILRDGNAMNVEGRGPGYDERLPHERNDSGSAPTSSENGPGEDTDAERARSTSSGATSWRSSDERGLTNTSMDSTKNLETLVQDIASVRLGSPPKKEAHPTKHSEVSYAAAAAAAASTNGSLGVQRTESAGAGRHNSIGSEGARRPSVMQKSNSDETTGHTRLA